MAGEQHRSGGFLMENLLLSESLKVIRENTEAMRAVAENVKESRLRVEDLQRLINNDVARNFVRSMDILERVLEFLEEHREEITKIPGASHEKLKNIEEMMRDVIHSQISIQKQTSEVESLVKSLEDVKEDTGKINSMSSDVGVISDWIKKKIPVFITIMMCFATAVGYVISIKEMSDKFMPMIEKVIKQDTKLFEEIDRVSGNLRDIQNIVEKDKKTTPP